MQGVVLQHGDEATRPKHPSHVTDGGDGVTKTVETLGAPDEVERLVRKRQRAEGGGDEGNPCISLVRRLLIGVGEVGQIDVGPGDEFSRPQSLGDVPSVEAVPARKVEHAHFRTER
jgi:hypothetical protein